MKKFFLLSVAFVLFFGCASRREIVRFQEDMTLIKNQLNALQSQHQKIQLELLTIQRAIANMEEAQKRNKADLMAEMHAFREEAVFLRNQLGDTGDRMSTLLHQVERAARPASDTLDSVHADSLNQTSLQSDPAIRPAALYESAYRDLKQGHYELALQGFREYIRRFPKSNFANNAQYWIGEIYYVKKDYETALVEFQKVLLNYPAGPKMPAALLKTGYCFIILNKPEQAKMAFGKIIKDYPGTQEAALAETRLNEMP